MHVLQFVDLAPPGVKPARRIQGSGSATGAVLTAWITLLLRSTPVSKNRKPNGPPWTPALRGKRAPVRARSNSSAELRQGRGTRRGKRCDRGSGPLWLVPAIVLPTGANRVSQELSAK